MEDNWGSPTSEPQYGYGHFDEWAEIDQLEAEYGDMLWTVRRGYSTVEEYDDSVEDSPSNGEMISKLVDSKFLLDQENINAFLQVDRKLFLPPGREDLGYKIFSSKWELDPGTYAIALEILRIKKGMSFLHLGAGSCYFSTIVGCLLGKGCLNAAVTKQQSVNLATNSVRKFVEECALPEFSAPVIADNFDDRFKQHTYDRILISIDRICTTADIQNQTIARYYLLKQNGVIVVIYHNGTMLIGTMQYGILRWAGYGLETERYKSELMPEVVTDLEDSYTVLELYIDRNREYDCYESFVDFLWFDRYIRTPAIGEAIRAVHMNYNYRVSEVRTSTPYFNENQFGDNLLVNIRMYASVLEVLQIEPGKRVLYVGSGCAYICTILAYLVGPYGLVHGICSDSSEVKIAKRNRSFFLKLDPSSSYGKFCEPQFFRGHLDLEFIMEYDYIIVSYSDHLLYSSEGFQLKLTDALVYLGYKAIMDYENGNGEPRIKLVGKTAPPLDGTQWNKIDSNYGIGVPSTQTAKRLRFAESEEDSIDDEDMLLNYTNFLFWEDYPIVFPPEYRQVCDYIEAYERSEEEEDEEPLLNVLPTSSVTSLKSAAVVSTRDCIASHLASQVRHLWPKELTATAPMFGKSNFEYLIPMDIRGNVFSQYHRIHFSGMYSEAVHKCVNSMRIYNKAKEQIVTGDADAFDLGSAAFASSNSNAVSSGGSNAVGWGDFNAVGSGGFNAVGSGDFNAVGSGGFNAVGSGGFNAIGSGSFNAVGSGGSNVVGSGGFNAVGSGGFNAVGSGGSNAVCSGGSNVVGSGGFNAVGLGDSNLMLP